MRRLHVSGGRREELLRVKMADNAKTEDGDRAGELGRSEVREAAGCEQAAEGEEGGLGWRAPPPCPLQTAAAAGTPSLSFWGNLLFATVLSLLRKTPLYRPWEPCAGPLSDLGWRNPLRGLSLSQGDHRPAPRSCRAHRARLAPPGPRAPSAALAWRFSSTSLSTCRVSARVRVGRCARTRV